MAFNPLPIVRADFRCNRLLVVVTVLLVALAVATGIAVVSQERALRQGSARAADDFDLLIGAPGSPTQLVLTAVYLQLQALPLVEGRVLAQAGAAPGVTYAAPIAFGDHWQGHPVVGTIADFASRGGALKPSRGRLFQRRGEAVVGTAVPLAVGQSFRPSHGLHAEVDAEDDDDAAGHHDHHHDEHDSEYTVVGRLPPRHNVWDTAILVPVEDIWQMHALPTGHDVADDHIGPPWQEGRLPGVPAIAVKPASVAAAYGLRSQFRTSRSTALFPAEVLNELYLTLGNVRDLMSVLALATQVLVVAAVLMALLVGFLARQRQFAVLRAIGAGRGYVFAVVWIEVAVLIVAGALLGVGLGYAASLGLSTWLAERAGFAMPVSLGMAEVRLLAGLVAAGLLIALLPAAQCFRRPIAAGLRN